MPRCSRRSVSDTRRWWRLVGEGRSSRAPRPRRRWMRSSVRRSGRARPRHAASASSEQQRHGQARGGGARRTQYRTAPSVTYGDLRQRRCYYYRGTKRDARSPKSSAASGTDLERAIFTDSGFREDSPRPTPPRFGIISERMTSAVLCSLEERFGASVRVCEDGRCGTDGRKTRRLKIVGCWRFGDTATS